MHEFESAWFFPIWLILMATTIVYLVLVNILFGYMRRHHNPEWVALGSPSFLNNSIANNFKFFRYFLFGNGYRNLQDRRVGQITLALRVLFVTCLALFVFLVLGALIQN